MRKTGESRPSSGTKLFYETMQANNRDLQYRPSKVSTLDAKQSISIKKSFRKSGVILEEKYEESARNYLTEQPKTVKSAANSPNQKGLR
jgi:hypothetical protein